MINIDLDKQDPWREKVSFFNQYDKELDTSFSTPEFEQEVMNAPRSHRVDPEGQENLARMREENIASAAKYRFDEQDELANIRLGKVITCIDFLEKLNKIIPARYTGLAKHGLLKLVVETPSMTGAEWQFVCGVQVGYNAEYSTFYFDEHNLPTSEMYRGWRTVLLRLITGGYISETEAHKVFGEANGPEARRYKEQLYFYRNR